MDDGGGLLTAADLEGYEVVEREPLVVQWRGHRLLTNPPPAFGGELVALGLLELESRPGWPTAAGSVSHAVSLAESMIATDEVRAAGQVGEELRRRSTGGTTHVSVADADGGAASMTTSNGEGSGWLLPGTGVMANNMMGEDDLHPGGFHSSAPGERVASMMAPSLVVDVDGAVRLAVGSGGSKRIRTALPQVIAAVVDQGRAAAHRGGSASAPLGRRAAACRARLERPGARRLGGPLAPHEVAPTRPLLRWRAGGRTRPRRGRRPAPRGRRAGQDARSARRSLGVY